MSSMRSTNSDVPRRPVLLLSVAVVVALLLGIWIGRALAPPQEEASPSTPSPEATGLSEHPQTEKGAIAAATEFSRVIADVSTDEDQYRQAIREVAAPDWTSKAEELADNTLSFLEERYGAEGTFSFVPARYRVVEFAENAATVDLWGVTLATGPKIVGVEETWITGTLELVWSSEGWRVAGQDSATGPTPELVRSEDERGGNPLSDFEEFGHAPTP